MERWHILLFGLLFTWILPIVVAATMLGVITLASGTVFLCRIIVRAWGSLQVSLLAVPRVLSHPTRSQGQCGRCGVCCWGVVTDAGIR
jgi:hypothetical protein